MLDFELTPVYPLFPFPFPSPLTRQKMKELSNLFDEANRLLLNPKGLHLLHPQRTAWLFLEIEYY